MVPRRSFSRRDVLLGLASPSSRRSWITFCQAPESTVGQPCGSLWAGNIHRIFGGIFKMLCVKWYTSVDSRCLSSVESMSKAFVAVDAGACFLPDDVDF
eukprot:2391986-Pyramimonas_sp.AAC.1